MNTPLVATHTQGQTRLSALHLVMIAGLVGNVVVNILLQALIVQELIVPLSIIMALTLVIAGIVARRWRWAALLAVLWCVASRWLRGFLIGTAALVLGASLGATIPPSDATAGVSAEALAQLPALVSRRNRFNQAELRARVGEIVALRLENSDTAGHYFDIDELNVHVAMPSGKPALALFTPTTPGTYTFYCHVPGHREAGMVGTLVAAP